MELVLPQLWLSLSAAVYFFLRLLFAVPLWPEAKPTTPPLVLPTVLAVVLPLPLALCAPATPQTLAALIATLLAATAALRFVRDAPARSPPLQALFWRLDIALFASGTLGLSALSDTVPSVCRAYAAAVAVVLVAFPFLRALNARTPQTSLLARLPALCATALQWHPVPVVPFTRVPPLPTQVSAFTLLSFEWLTHLVATGYKRPLQPTDVHPVRPFLSARAATEHGLAPAWDLEARSARPNLLRALWRAFGLRFTLAGLLRLATDAALFVPPVMLRWITQYLQERDSANDAATATGLLMALGLLAAYLSQSLTYHHYMGINFTVHACARGSLISLMYAKSCRLSPESRAKYTSGQIQNMMSTDTRSIADAILYLHTLWSPVVQVAVAMVLLVSLLGWLPTIAGLACIFATMPLQTRIATRTKTLRLGAASQTDERVKAVSEAVGGIKLVKLYAWELSFVRRILALRAKELKLIRGTNVLQACTMFVAYSLPTLLTLIVFVVFSLEGNRLDAATVFPSIALFAVIRPGLNVFPLMFAHLVRTFASLERIEKFLLSDDLEPLDDGEHAINQDVMERDDLAAAAENASFSWDPSSSNPPTLSDVTLQIPSGALVAIVGPTGSGKSTLLASFLGEVPVTAGHAGLRKGLSVALCDQVPFIQNASVKDNILFGRAVEEANYIETVAACCLQPDLEILPAGDETEIGGRGVNLSGGQRARVSLARAAYARADIVLLDDPLSAVDAHVGKKMFHECIVKKMGDATRLFSTNQIHFAASAAVDIIVVVKNGAVVESGPRGDLLANPSSEFSQLLESAGELGAGVEQSDGDTVNESADESVDESVDETVDEQSPLDADGDPETEKSGSNDKIETDEKLTPTNKEAQEKEAIVKKSTNYGTMKAGKLTQAEKKSEGKVRFRHYKAYLLAMGIWQFVLPSLVLMFCTESASMAVSIWLSVWSEASHFSGGDPQSVTSRLAVFILFGLGTVVFSGGGGFLLAFGGVRAAMYLHEKLLLSVLGAPSAFFNSTPQGRLVNRFSSDVDKIDTQLSAIYESLGRTIMSLCFAVAINVWAAPHLIVLVVPIGALFVYLQDYFRKTVVDLYRLEALARSPLYSHFSETLDGVMTIRAYGTVERGIRISEKYTDDMVKTTLSTNFVKRWMAVRLDAMGTVFIFGATLSAVLSPAGGPSAATLSLVLSYTMQLISILTYTARFFTEVESNMNAMERVTEYSEPPFPQEERGGLESLVRLQKVPGMQLDENEARGFVSNEKLNFLNNAVERKIEKWPSAGDITFENVEMRYKPDLPPALREISFTAVPGEQIGIVGRTGAGKSSVIQSLFRLYEPSDGRILIDGVDISTLRLFDLRSSIGIIPQEPVCFSGTIRSNLDMFGENNDATVLRALDLCGLQDTMRERVGLDYNIAENGSNLSVGQRQLLCLGRALLKGSQVLVLDEATSSVSNEADEKIQQTLREEMSQCTILTVAHRLHTVIQSDRIIVMDKGRIAEVGKPAELLSQASMLSDLVDETGPSTAARLRKLAETPRGSPISGE